MSPVIPIAVRLSAFQFSKPPLAKAADETSASATMVMWQFDVGVNPNDCSLVTLAQEMADHGGQPD